MRKFVVAVTTATLLFAGIGTAAADPVASAPAADIASATGSTDPAGLINTLSAIGAAAGGSTAAPLTDILALAAASGTMLAPLGHTVWCVASTVFSAAPCA